MKAEGDAEPSGGLAAAARLMSGKPLDEGDEPAEDTHAADYEAAESEASDAVMSALKSGDRTAFRAALKDFVRLCAMDE